MNDFESKVRTIEEEFYKMIDEADITSDSKIKLKERWIGLRNSCIRRWNYDHPRED